MRRGGKPPQWWKQLLFYDVVEFCCLTEKTALPGSVLSNHCWINQLPTWILEHLEDCLPRPNPRWLLQHTALLPRSRPVDTLVLMPPVFSQGLLKGDRSFSLWSHAGRAGRNSYTFGRTDRSPLELNQRDEFQHTTFNLLNHFRCRGIFDVSRLSFKLRACSLNQSFISCFESFNAKTTPCLNQSNSWSFVLI